MIRGKVVRVVDGDTIEVEVPKFKVRMDFIDAPETRGSERELGLITKQWLKDRIEGKEVELNIKTFDMYYRALAVVYDLEGNNINGEMVEKSLVEIYSPNRHDDGKLEAKK